jgi:hypothetical protein
LAERDEEDQQGTRRGVNMEPRDEDDYWPVYDDSDVELWEEDNVWPVELNEEDIDGVL